MIFLLESINMVNKSIDVLRLKPPYIPGKKCHLVIVAETS